MQLTDTLLWQELESKCSNERKYVLPLDNDKLKGAVKNATSDMADVLNRTCKNFEDYTLHDEQHALSVVENMYRLMGESVVKDLNVIEISLLILAAYGHDTGMAIARERRDELRKSTEYRHYLTRNERTWQEAEDAREKGDAPKYEFLSALLFQGFLRGTHHIESERLMLTHFVEKLSIGPYSLAEPVGTLCRSHGESVEKLTSYSSFACAKKFVADIPFLACVLRLADYCDMDSSRAPESLFRLLQPGTEISRREWRKQQAARFYLDERTISFQATFDDFFEEKSLRDTLAGLEQERRECMELLRKRTGKGKHMLCLDASVDVEGIRSNGYVYEEFRFQLEYREILSLLMGTKLYSDERVFVRELIQNALDACRHANAAAGLTTRPDYSGRISVRHVVEGSSAILEVSDNGSGMTMPIVRDYFMRVGRSYYNSYAFRSRSLPMHAVSQFGIGILSCFMVADRLEVETCADPIVHSDADDGDLKPMKLEIHGPDEFFVVRESGRRDPGTTIRVFLRAPLAESVKGLVERFVARIPFEVTTQDSNDTPIRLISKPFDVELATNENPFVGIADAFGYTHRDLVFEGPFGLGIHGTMRFFLLESNDRRYLELHNAGNFSLVRFDQEGQTLVIVKQIDGRIRDGLDVLLTAVRKAAMSFPNEVSNDIVGIADRFSRLCEQLMRQHHSVAANAQWKALTAQVEALYHNPQFQASPRSIQVQEKLNNAKLELESFVSGECRLDRPDGILTQDGIDLNDYYDLPYRLQIGVGFVYNLDFCGEYRLSLSAARDKIIEDDKCAKLVAHLHGRIGDFLGRWFREEGIGKEQVAKYADGVPRLLGEHVKQAYFKI